MRAGLCIGRTGRLGRRVGERIFRRAGNAREERDEAARFIAERGIIEEGGPLLVRFIAQVASRFGVVVTQKVAAQALPVVGALGGAAVNYAFIEHFQEVARGHFTVRRLERVYGKNFVRTEYERVAQEQGETTQVRKNALNRIDRPKGPAPQN